MEKQLQTRHERAKKILDEVVTKILDGGAVKYVRQNLEMFADASEIPCQKWSSLNRLLVSVNDTTDARGIRQWNEAGRSVKKGASAFYIFVPMFRTEKDEATKEEEKHLSGFRLMPVFKVEDTEGKELPYQAKMRSLDVEKLPLIGVAKKLGVKVGKEIMCNGAAGCYRPKKNEIMLGASHPQVFLHELSHAVDCALGNYGEGYAAGEVVAELSSAFLGSLYGVKVDLDNTKAYIENWAGKEHVAFKVLATLERVVKIYLYIDNARNEIAEEKKKMLGKAKTKVPQKDGNNFVLPFKTEDFKERSQVYNAKNGRWVKRDMSTGRFTAVKKDGKPFSRVKVEKPPIIIPMPDFGTFPPAA